LVARVAGARVVRGTALLLAGAAPLLAAAVIHNSRLLGRPAGLATNGGLNFFLAHAPFAAAHYREGDYTHRIMPIKNLMYYPLPYWSPRPFYDEAHFYREGLALLAQKPSRLL